jgi:hypothetical protein
MGIAGIMQGVLVLIRQFRGVHGYVQGEELLCILGMLGFMCRHGIAGQ